MKRLKYLNIIAEGSTEENFVNNVMVEHFAALNIFVSVRKITTGWDKTNSKAAKGGFLKYIQFKNDVLRWIKSEKNRENTYYTSFIDLYAFPQDEDSRYTKQIQNIKDCYKKINALENAISQDIAHQNFIPYVQLHEFEAFILVAPERLTVLYPESEIAIEKLKNSILGLNPEEINEFPQTAPSKRIIQYLPTYEKQKAQVGALVAEDIGLDLLREKCPHFNEWITKLENI